MTPYIINCISRILMAPCAPQMFQQRSIDLAEAIRLASDEGLEKAHQYLGDMVTKAEQGTYK